MTSSGTSTFNPALSDFTLYAFSLCGVKRTELLAQHLSDARMAANLMQMEWNNRGPMLWKVDLQSQALTQATATYTLSATTIAVLDAYISTTDGTNTTDRLIFPVSRSDYAAIPTKLTQAPPTQFWFDRLIIPTITLWPVPDQTSVYTLKYYRYAQIEDAVAADGTTLNSPQRWFDAFAWGLAARLAVIYAPDRAQPLDQRAERAFQIAANQDVEMVPMYISPGLSGYFR